jgi:serine/threonine protein phosphatase PrpC
MGNCLGKTESDNHCSSKLGLPPASQRIFDKDFLHLHIDSVGAAASSAHFAAASSAQNTYSITHKCSEDTVFIGLIEGVGLPLEASALTAAFVKKHLLQTFQETCHQYGGLDQHKHAEILRSTLQSLHCKCLASRTLPRSTHSSFGASATLALVNLATHTCTVANSGHSRCLIAGVSGSFNSKRPHCTWASTLHTTRNQKEKIHADRHHKHTLIPLFPRKNIKQGVVAGHPDVFLTRALGIINTINNNSSYDDKKGPRKAFNDSSSTTITFENKSDVEVDINIFHLTPTEGHVIIGSSGFWDVVAPPSVALRAHLFSRVNGNGNPFNFFHFSRHLFLLF